MTTTKLTAEETETLNQLTAEMKGLLTELKETRSLTKAEFNKKFELKVASVLGKMESQFGVPALQPEVPTKTQKTFFALQNVYSDYYYRQD